MCGREFAKQDDAVDVTKSSIPHKIGRGLDRMIEQLREAAVVVITTYDRLSRSLQNLLNIVEAIRAKVVGFRTMAKDTNFNAGRLVFASIAQFERERISEQTKEGLCLSTSEGGLAVSPVLYHLSAAPRQLVCTIGKGMVLPSSGGCSKLVPTPSNPHEGDYERRSSAARNLSRRSSAQACGSR
jgi:hypothetical protein